jgi:two-component sensor histidine kinase
MSSGDGLEDAFECSRLLEQLDDARREIDELRRALEGCERELGGAHHRVSNGLLITAAFLRLQIPQTPGDASKRILRAAMERIEAMGQFHRHLVSASTSQTVDFSVYLENVAADIAAITGAVCKVRVASEIFIGGDVAMNLAIVVNELVVNAKKHAGKRARDIEIGCSPGDDGHLHLEVTHDGPGLPPDFDLEHPTDLGISVVCGIVRQLGGEISAETDCSARFRISIPISSGNGERTEHFLNRHLH